MPRITCQCGKTLDISEPVFEIINNETVAMIVINHGMLTGNKCSHCGSSYWMAIQGFNMAAIQLAMVPVPAKEEKSSLITEAPANFNPKRLF